MNTEQTEPVFDKKTWKTDPNAYARNYYKEKGEIMITCTCGKHVKKLTIAKHLKSKNHKVFLSKTDLQKTNENKIHLIQIEIKKLKNDKIIEMKQEIKKLKDEYLAIS
jgi:hypothetical protein